MKIDHLGIAVRSIGDALAFYRDALGLEPQGVEEVAEQGARVAMLPVGESRIELLEPLAGDSVIARFIARRGEGIHHICFEVADLEAKLDELRQQGCRVLDGYPRRGAEGKLVAFIHPASASGVLIELSQELEHSEGAYEDTH